MINIVETSNASKYMYYVCQNVKFKNVNAFPGGNMSNCTVEPLTVDTTEISMIVHLYTMDNHFPVSKTRKLEISNWVSTMVCMYSTYIYIQYNPHGFLASVFTSDPGCCNLDSGSLTTPSLTILSPSTFGTSAN